MYQALNKKAYFSANENRRHYLKNSQGTKQEMRANDMLTRLVTCEDLTTLT